MSTKKRSPFPAQWWRCCLRDGSVAESSITLMSLQPQSYDSTATRWARQPTATICSAKAFITLITHGAKQLQQPSEALAARLETRWGRETSDESKQEAVLFFLAFLHIINLAHQQLDKLEWWIWPLWIDTNTWSIKIPDSVLSLRKCGALKDKRNVFAVNDIWSSGRKVRGRVCLSCENVEASQC